MNKISYYFFLLLIAGSCTQALEFDEKPEIQLISMSKNSLAQSFIPDFDSILITIGFVDGDGDFGFNSTDTSKVYVVDSRTGFTYDFRIPQLNASGTRGIEGDITVRTGSVCCIFEDGDVPCTVRPDYPIDTMVYDIYIEDLSGNISNTIRTPTIFISCN